MRRKRGQELAALNRIRRRGFVLLEINGNRNELWDILKELDCALKNLQEANWNYFDRISDDDFERDRAEHYERAATDNCTELQDLILARLRDEPNHTRADESRPTSAGSDSNGSTSYVSVKHNSDEIRQRTRNDEGSGMIERSDGRTNENRPNPTVLFRSSLPRLELETFDGDVSQWPRWHSLFKSLVDEQPLSNDEKMAHLQSAVTGLARHTIGGMLFDGNLYEDAMAALKDRFGRDEDIVHANLSRVFSSPSPVYLDPSSLEKFHGSVHCAVTVLNNLGYEGDLCSTENLRRAVQKLPSELKRDWGEYSISIRKPNLIHFDSWLQKQVRIALNYAAVSSSSSKRTTVVPDSQRGQRSMRSTLTTEAAALSSRVCACCGSGVHQLDECPSFGKMNVAARSQFVFVNRRCFSCLKKGHLARYCKFRGNCGIHGCSQNHRRMLHDETQEQRTGNIEEKIDRAIAVVQKTPQTLLQVVPVRVHGAYGRTRDTLALLDPGSQTSLCADAVVHDLRISGADTQLLLNHIGGAGPPLRSSKFKLYLSPLTEEDNKQIVVPEAFSVPHINIRTPLLSGKAGMHWNHLKGITIPDCTKGKVELLLGANVIEAVLQREVRVGRAGQPVAIRTAFGWTLTGTVSEFVPETIKQIMFIERAYPDSEAQLTEQVQTWWTTESFGTKFVETDKRSPEDVQAQKELERTTTYCGERYKVRLLWRSARVIMPKNKTMAFSRLKSLERSLLRQPQKAKTYQETIQKYVEQGHARKLTEAELEIDSEKRWYLPHHAVSNPNKPNLRVVFDAAASFAGRSLNDELLKGPDLLHNLIGILLRFRQETIALMADIEQMFHQIRIFEDDQPALSFLWRNLDTSKEPDVYQMTVSIFGMKCSPAIATYVLRRTAEDHGESTPASKAAVLAVKQNFYMDDFLRSEPNITMAMTMQREVTKLVARGGFRLTKWMSNNLQVLENIDPLERAHSDLESVKEGRYRQRALGCVWIPSEDVIGIHSQVHAVSMTKRGILQGMASVFDPLGVVSPFTLKAKLLIQRLWTLKYSWDEQLSGAELDDCKLWLSQASHLQDIFIPRCFREPGGYEIARRELHVFCDASEHSFAAVAYIRTVGSNGNKFTSFVMSRTRLAPLKQLTIVRLELQAAVLAVRLADTIKKEVTCKFDETVLWSDSKVVINYIQNESRRFHTFVANRISEIHTSSSIEEWHHISGKMNPADIGSRGASLVQLKNMRLWWRGPYFLELNREDWPDQPEVHAALNPCDIEVKMSPVVAVTTPDELRPRLLDSERFSSWHKYIRTISWILRFVKNTKSKLNRSSEESTAGPLSSEEIRRAEIFILREDQQARGQHGLKHMSPFTDRHGIQRVGGRINRAPIAYISQHPIILSPASDITRLIVLDIHKTLLHSGPNHTLNEFRMKYWMPRARGTVKRLLNGCIFCRNRRAHPTVPLMASLPEERFDHSRPFSAVGIDYFGPLKVRKFRKTEKRFVLLITCLSTRALHLEMACALDTDAFLMALRRFMGRRGKPKVIISDRGTNFIAGERELREGIEAWNQSQITNYLSQHQIVWKWNPPAAPHMGGVWERLVASVKRALKVVLGNQCVSEDVLHTALVEVEYMLNGRPLTYISMDERDPEALTPNHFLLGPSSADSGRVLPPGVFGDHDLLGRRRWRHSQVLANHLWKRWRKEYLPTLLARQKWRNETGNLQVGDVVLILDDSAPRGFWPLARVTEVYPGSDGRVRSADVKTSSGTYRRPVTKLCLLETPQSN